MDVEQRLERIEESLNLVLRAVQGETATGNLGLVRRVTATENRIDKELGTARALHDELEDMIQSNSTEIAMMKLRMAGYGFGGAVGGGGVLVAILKGFGVI